MSRLLHSELLASGRSSGFYTFVKSLADCTSKAVHTHTEGIQQQNTWSTDLPLVQQEEHGRVEEELERLSARMGHPDVSSVSKKKKKNYIDFFTWSKYFSHTRFISLSLLSCNSFVKMNERHRHA